MKKTQRIELLNTIKSTKVSFISITFFVALAVAIFVGLSWTGDGVRDAIDRQMNETNYYDIELSFPYGFTNSDIKKIRKLDGVSEVEPTRVAYGTYDCDNYDYQVKIQQINKNINKLVLVEGELPTKVGEIAIKEDFADRLGIGLGDSIKINNQEIVDGSKINKLMRIDTNDISGEADDLEEGYLVTDTFTVTAIVNSMQYIMTIPNTYGSTLNGAQPIDALMYVLPRSFRDNAYSGYNNIYIRSDQLRGLNTYSDKYKDECEKLKDSITDDIVEISTNRYNSIKNKADDTTDAIDNELSETWHSLTEGNQKIKNATNKLAKINDNISKIKNYIAKASSQLNTLDPEDPAYAVTSAEIKKSRKSLADLNAAAATLAKQIKNGKNELNRLYDEYADDSSKADDIKETLKDIHEYDCVIATREYNVGLTSLEIVCECVDKLRLSMAMLFLIVGLLVCYSAVSRIVYSQTTRIGTKKALGMKESEISIFYLIYAGTTAVVGSLVGVLLAACFVEKVMMNSLKGEYLLYSARTYLSAGVALEICAIEIILIVACGWLACHKILKQEAVTLLRGPLPPKNRERLFERFSLWKKRSLLTKTIVNNCINDKRRVFATLVGVAGCTAMIVCSIMLKDNIVLGIQKQYDEIFNFNQIVMFDENVDDAEQEISDVLDDNNISHSMIKKEMATITLPEGRRISTDLFASNDSSFYDMVKVNQIGEADMPTNKGVWVTHAYANEYGTKVGDTIEIVDSIGKVHRLKINGFTECYLTRGLIIMSPEAYESEFNKDIVNNAALIKIADSDVEKVNDQLSGIDGYYAINDYCNESWNFFQSFTAVSGALVAVYLILAIIMTLLVLLNLFVMFVEEKRIELIVLMINGFSVRKAKSYIYRDTIYITIAGIILGAVFGTMMGRQTISSFENAATAMIKTTDVPACMIAAGVAAILTTIMVLIAVRRIDKFELSDINRE